MYDNMHNIFWRGYSKFFFLNNVFTILINILNNIITGTPPPKKKNQNPNPKLPKVTPAPQRKKYLPIFFYLPFL